jgi:hypothetical protein
MARNFNVRHNPQIYLDIQKQIDYYREETGSNKLGKCCRSGFKQAESLSVALPS